MAHGKTVPHSMKEAMSALCAGKNGPSLPQLSELAEHFIRLRGGAFKVAQMLSVEWDSAPAGGIARTRILDMLLRVWKSGNDQTRTTDDLGILNDADLQALLARKLEALPTVPEEPIAVPEVSHASQP